jgi:8-oxo-dGTP diphosphatase
MLRGIDYIGVSCIFICHDGQGRIMMHRRSQNCRDEQGRWDFGGGGLEHGETFEEAIRRELMEEFNVVPIEVRYVGTRNLIRLMDDGSKSHWISNLHIVQIDPAQVCINEPDKVDELGWFRVDQLPEPLHSAIDEFEIGLIKQHLDSLK